MQLGQMQLDQVQMQLLLVVEAMIQVQLDLDQVLEVMLEVVEVQLLQQLHS